MLVTLLFQLNPVYIDTEGSVGSVHFNEDLSLAIS